MKTEKPKKKKCAVKKVVRNPHTREDLARAYLLAEAQRIQMGNSIDKIKKKGLEVMPLLGKNEELFKETEEAIRADIMTLCGDKQYARLVDYLKGYKGISEWSAILPLLFIDIHKAAHFGKLIKYAGLAPVPVTYKCPEHGSFPATEVKIVSRHYVCPHCKSTETVVETGKADFYDAKGSVHYNKQLKMVLIGRIATNLLRANGAFKERYDEYKEKSLTVNPDWRKGQHHSKAVRKMVRDYLFVVWKSWRDFEGLVVPEPFAKDLPVRWVYHDSANRDVIHHDNYDGDTNKKGMDKDNGETK